MEFAYGPKKKRGIIKRHKVVAGVLGFVLALSGGAMAAWLIGGSGTGYVKAGSTVPLTTNNIPPADLGGNLFPGGTAGLSISLNNGNDYPVVLQAVRFDSGPDSDDPAACPSSNVGFAQGNAIAGLNLGPIPANGTATVVVPNAVSMSADAPTGCQGVRFSVFVGAMEAVAA